MELELAITVFFLLSFLTIASGEVYIVHVEGEPVVSYNGGVDGFSATAIDITQEMDITR